MVSFTIHGEPCSKANSRQIVVNRKTGRPAVIKSRKGLKYLEDAHRQVPLQSPLLKGELVVHMTIYYASQSPDLDESLILDAMQGRIYENDRQVRQKHIFHAIDKARPRAEIRVEPRNDC